MAPSTHLQEDDSAVAAVLVIAAAVVGIYFANFYLEKQFQCNVNCWIIQFRKLEIYPLSFISAQYAEYLDALNALDSKHHFSFLEVVKISYFSLRWWSYLAGTTLCTIGAAILSFHSLRRVRTSLSAESLRKVQEQEWSATAPVAGLDLVNKNVEGYEYAVKPGAFAVQNGILIDYRVVNRPVSSVSDAEWLQEKVRRNIEKSTRFSEEDPISPSNLGSADEPTELEKLGAQWIKEFDELVQSPNGLNPSQEFFRTFGQHQIISDGEFLPNKAKKVFIAQLGPQYREFNTLLEHQQALFGVFSSAILRDPKKTHALLRELAYSYQSGIKYQNAIEEGRRNADNPRIAVLCSRHHYVITMLMGLFEEAKRYGKFPSSEFGGWLKPTDRILFYALNSVNANTAWVEAAGPFAHYASEKIAEDHNMKCRNALGPIWHQKNDLDIIDAVVFCVLAGRFLRLSQVEEWEKIQLDTISVFESQRLIHIADKLKNHPNIQKITSAYSYTKVKLLALRIALYLRNKELFSLKAIETADQKAMGYLLDSTVPMDFASKVLWGEFLAKADRSHEIYTLIGNKSFPVSSLFLHLREPFVDKAVVALHKELWSTAETRTPIERSV